MRKLAGSLLTVAMLALATGPCAADDGRDAEAQIGAQVYQQLQQKREIVARSAAPAEYAVLDPIARRIAAVADPQYDFPFDFIVVHEKSPNAFAVPGGHVYVTDSLLKFVQNKQELAGVLCHETSHDIHHDVVDNNAKNQRLGTIIGIVGAVTGLGNSGFGQTGEGLAYTLQSQGYSREVETNADHKGAQTCSVAGYNPWGMIWLFENFEKADSGGSMEALSDHPTDEHRIADLEREFAADPHLFGGWSSNVATATPIGSPSNGLYAGLSGSRPIGSVPSAATVSTPGRVAPQPVARRTSGYCCNPHDDGVPATSARSQHGTATATGSTRPNGNGTTIDDDGTVTGQ